MSIGSTIWGGGEGEVGEEWRREGKRGGREKWREGKGRKGKEGFGGKAGEEGRERKGERMYLMYGWCSGVSASVNDVHAGGDKGWQDEAVPLLGGITKAAAGRWGEGIGK